MNIDISGPIGLFALGLPLAALATVVLLAARGARRGPRAAAEPRERESVAPREIPAAPGTAARPAEPPPPVEADEKSLDERFFAARGLALAGKPADAAEALRACLWEAGRQARKDVQAEARLALGDLCLAAGDTITACEHWQIARDYFHDLKRGTEMDETLQRMKSNGCPTDWVLNDF